MGWPVPPAAVWGDMASSYRVTVPEGREWLYEWAGPTFLALGVVAGGLWLARGRSTGTGPARALLWAAAGCLAVSYSAWWVWAHRGDVVLEPGWAAWAAVAMPWLWVAASAAVVWRGWRRVHPPVAARPSPEAAGLDAAADPR